MLGSSDQALLRIRPLQFRFAYGTITRSGLPSQVSSARFLSASAVLLPRPNCLVRFGLLRFRSPLLTKSFSYFLLLQVLRCFSSPRFTSFDSELFKFRGFPIRTSTARRLFAPPRSFSQLTTSFVCSNSLGIPRAPFFAS
jgi:hypothetical protein